VPDNGYVNFLASFRKRCNYHSNAVSTDRVIRSSLKLINLLAPTPLAGFEWSEDLYTRWSARFDPPKRQRMEQALQDWIYTTTKEYGTKDIFVKTEALLAAHKPNWAPRVIYKGGDVYNLISGPIFWELTKRLSGCYDRMDGPHRFRMPYGRTPEQYVPFLNETDGGEFLEADFSANDMKQPQDVMRLEMMLMRRLGCPEWFIRLHATTNLFRVRSREHGISAEL